MRLWPSLIHLLMKFIYVKLLAESMISGLAATWSYKIYGILNPWIKNGTKHIFFSLKTPFLIIPLVQLRSQSTIKLKGFAKVRAKRNLWIWTRKLKGFTRMCCEGRDT